MHINKKIKKAVFPVAGLGTRFLPATKASPKEMLTVVDKPLIQYAVEEAIQAGIEELIFITSGSKRAIEDHFDNNFELMAKLEERGQKDLLAVVRDILPANVHCIYLRQKEALGLGHAVLCAKPVVNDEPFAVLLADDLFLGEAKNTLSEMMTLYEEKNAGVIAVEEVNDPTKYGIIAGDNLHEKIINIHHIVEKPSIQQAPSNLGVAGRYILPVNIFSALEQKQKNSSGELQLTDAIADLIQAQSMLAYRFPGKRYDCGDKLGYLKATVACGLQHADLGSEFNDYLQNLDLIKPVS